MLDGCLDEIRKSTEEPRRQADVAAFLGEAHLTETVLTGQWHGRPSTIQLRHPARMVMTNDRNFDQILAESAGKVDLMLVAQPNGVSPHAIEDVCPGIWELGRPWLTLGTEIGGVAKPWRLHRVVPPWDRASTSSPR